MASLLPAAIAALAVAFGVFGIGPPAAASAAGTATATATTASPSDLDYFDRLRPPTADATSLYNATLSYRTEGYGPGPGGSSVVEVTLPSPSNEAYRLCHLISMTPLSRWGSVRQGDLDFAGAALLAVLHWNSRNDVVVPNLYYSSTIRSCDVKFTIEYMDTEYSPIVASGALIKDVLSRGSSPSSRLSDPLPVALLGARGSVVSAPLATLGTAMGLPQISHKSTGNFFDNKDQYRYFGRVVASNADDAVAAVDYLKNVVGATHVGVLYERDNYGISFQREFVQAAIATEPHMEVRSASFTYSEDGTSNLVEAVEQLRGTGYRYFFGIIKHGDDIMRECYRAGIAGPGYFWFFGDGSSVMMGSNFGYYSTTQADLIEAVRGVAIILPSVEVNEQFVRAWDTLEEDRRVKEYFKSKMPESINTTNFRFSPRPDQFALLMYDAVMALGFAACSIKGDPFFDGPTLYNAFTRTDFAGASGQVKFDTTTGTRDAKTMTYRIFNIVPNEPDEQTGFVTFTSDAKYEYRRVVKRTTTTSSSANGGEAQREEKESVEWAKLSPFVYSDGGTVPPPVLPAGAEDRNHMGAGVLAVGLCLAGLTMILSMACAGWTFIHRKSRVVKASQPEFLVMLCIGTLILASSVIPMSLQEPVGQAGLDIACMSTVWLACIGFVVSFSALLSKAWRINKIFHRRPFDRVASVKTQDVMLPFIILMTLNIALLVSWTLVAPLKWRRLQSVSVDRFGRSAESYAVCQADENSPVLIFVILLAILNVSCLAFANYQAYQTRKIKADHSESHYVAFSMASISQAVIIGIPVFAVVFYNPRARFLIYSSIVSIICAAVLLPLFVPKIIARETEQSRPTHNVLNTSEFLSRVLNADKQIALSRICVGSLPGDLSSDRKLSKLSPSFGSRSSQAKRHSEQTRSGFDARDFICSQILQERDTRRRLLEKNKVLRKELRRWRAAGERAAEAKSTETSQERISQRNDSEAVGSHTSQQSSENELRPV